ncbi:NAD-dependent epimerase/dehydratase family protein [Pedobacter gandavensis]|uniref:NAD-dependent epimerase/dehydratase family protein n=1 Tax=Pedobacter gandavensis TaxID=2679963 RepID=UPI00292FD985|nr:NAD-dependent epimerase/dehydratase family protein [Pedobacter gandavensis]
MKITVTGASGFVGKNLVSYLNRAKHNITTLSARFIPNQTFELNNNAIIHLSGKAHDLRSVSLPNEYFEANYELTRQLYDAFLVSEAKVFIFISSVKAAVDLVEGILVENTECNPLTIYGKSKLMAEEYIQSCRLPAGKSYYILRPCMIHGPGNKGNLNLLYRFVRSGIPYPLAAFENNRSFLSIENLCFVICELLKKDIPSGIYNVADDGSLSTNELVEILASSLGKKPKLWHVSSNLIRSIAVIGDKLKLPFNTERLNKLTENYIVSNAKIKAALEVEFPLTIKEGLKITATSFKS